MNDRELDLALDAVGTSRTRVSASPALRERVRAIPLTTPQRSWLPESPKWRFQSMFSATKAVIAGAIVAQLGGFLLAGFLIERSEGLPDPAAVTAISASPDASPAETPTSVSTAEPGTAVRTDILPGVALTVKEVDAGIFRIVSDGHGRDLQARLTTVLTGGLDGDVWVGAEAQLFKLGHPESVLARDRMFAAPDGTWWSLDSAESTTPRLFRIDGSDVVEHPLPDWEVPEDPEDVQSALDVTPDGRVWVAISRDPEEPLVAVLEGGEWTVLPSTQEAWATNATNRDRRLGHDCCAIAVGPDGVVWLADRGQAVRLNGSEWKSPKPFILSTGGFGHLANWAMGDDGTLWSMGVCSGDALLRNDRSGWKVWNVIGWDGCAGYGTVPTATPDGRLWLHFIHHVGGATNALVDQGIIARPDRDAPNCDAGSSPPTMGGASPGVLSFDGRRWRQYLAGHCVSDVTVASDGSVWVTDTGTKRIGELPSQSAGLYVITPGAVAAAE